MKTTKTKRVKVKSVLCPVCNGAKQLPYQKRGGCQCCKGKGTITKERADVLSMIRKDLAARLVGG